MPVKCLNIWQQRAIVEAFLAKTQNIDDLALQYRRSRRTIIRVLEDNRVDPGIKTRVRKPQAAPVIPVVIKTYTPWYRKFFNAFVQACQ